MAKKVRHPDIQAWAEGSIALLQPQNEAGIAWVNENIGKDNGYQPYWPTVLCGPRYAADITESMEADGLMVGYGSPR